MPNYLNQQKWNKRGNTIYNKGINDLLALQFISLHHMAYLLHTCIYNLSMSIFVHTSSSFCHIHAYRAGSRDRLRGAGADRPGARRGTRGGAAAPGGAAAR